MSDYDNRSRPILERIACMRGKSAGLVIAFGGGAPMLTDGDISAAVGLTRQRDDSGKPIPTCIRPELLQLHYAGGMDFAYRVARAAWNEVCKYAKKEDGHLARLGCILAAQSLGGRSLTQEAVKEEAWVAGRNYAALDREIGYALAWMNGEMHEAAREFVRLLDSRIVEKAKNPKRRHDRVRKDCG